jgi:hypothetical protein
VDDAVVLRDFWVVDVMGLSERDEMRLKSVVFELDSLLGVGKVLRGRIGLLRLLEGGLDQS